MKGKMKRRSTEARPKGAGKSGGAVMYIAMLVVVTLAAIGTIGVRSVQFEIATSGHMRQAAQTRYVSETGVMVSIWRFGSSGALTAFLKKMDQCTTAEKDRCGEGYWQFNFNDNFSTHAPGVFVRSSGPGSYHAFGYAPLSPDFLVRVNNKIPIIAVPGYSIAKTAVGGDDYEFQKWAFTSNGTAEYSPVLNRTDSSETIRVMSVLGPVKREK
jgi:hypothetical protein